MSAMPTMPPWESVAAWLLLLVLEAVEEEEDVKLMGYCEKMSPEMLRRVPFADCCSQPACNARRT